MNAIENAIVARIIDVMVPRMQEVIIDILHLHALEDDRARSNPVPMVLYCPAGHQHIDEGEWATNPHKTHRCQHITIACAETGRQVCGSKLCGLAWRPADFPTVGVAVLEVP